MATPYPRARSRLALRVILSVTLALSVASAVHPAPAQAFGSQPGVGMTERTFRHWAVGRTFGPNRYTHGGTATITGWHWVRGTAAVPGAWHPYIHYGVDPRYLMAPVSPMSPAVAHPSALGMMADCSWCPWDWDWAGFFDSWEQGHFLNFFTDFGRCLRGATIDMKQVYAGQAIVLLVFGWASKLNPHALAAVAVGNCLATIFKW